MTPRGVTESVVEQGALGWLERVRWAVKNGADPPRPGRLAGHVAVKVHVSRARAEHPPRTSCAERGEAKADPRAWLYSTL
jgi:hypothetical protein